MKRPWFFCILGSLAGWGQAADETARIEALRLFKNGLAAVHLTDHIPDAGSVTIHHLPSPVHGTFWVQSDKPVTARVALEARPVPLASFSQVDLLRRLAGKPVTLHLEKDSLQGRLLGSDAATDKQWDRDYASLEEGQRYGWNLRSGSDASSAAQPSLLFLQQAPGKVVAVDPGQVRRVEFDQLPELTAERPVLRLEAQGAAQVSVDYLTKGISWAPSYRVDLSDPAKLSLSQQAVIRNELVDLKEVEFQLISGFPSVRYAAVDSPLSPGTTWASFFSQVNQSGRGDGPNDPFSNSGALSQTVQLGREPASAAALGVADQGEGVDLHYESIGRRTLARGETLAVNVATASSPYERVVEWHIPDNRDASGRPVQDYQRRQQSQESFDETPWDAIRFANPFRFPMTTAPAMLVSGGQFQGQQLCTWTNPGEQASIRITKALSLSTRSTEHEIPESRQNLRIAGNDCYKARVEGALTVKNYRARPAVLVIKRRFSGELLEAAGNPTKQLLEEGVYSINKRNELNWRLELAAGAEQSLKYQYEVLVDQ